MQLPLGEHGLKQASHNLFSKFSISLLQDGFQQSKGDYSTFTLKVKDLITIVLVYVDTIILTGNDSATIASIKQFVHSKFKIKDLDFL